jgi:hypothetical protein
MISGNVYGVAVMATGILALELLPTDQTSFSFPDDGTGVALPFPDTIASLTGLSDWPDVWVTPPFTPNMVALFNPNATSIIGDIISPPNAVGV